MDRVGGINFHPRKAGGYQPNAGFENHFSGLIFGMGKWKEADSWWDGVIPLRYLEIRPRV